MSSKTIFLASKSPRRRDLLTRLGYDVRVIASNAHTLMAFEGDEVVLPDEAPKAYVLRTARNKFLEGLGVKNAGEFAGVRLPIVAADTVVSLGNEILGKPRDFDEACLFLEKLSGRTHDVRTAVYVGLSETACDWRISHSTVSFRELTHDEIEAYANSGEPYDKAGGYGIQGLASIFISNISGSYTMTKRGPPPAWWLFFAGAGRSGLNPVLVDLHELDFEDERSVGRNAARDAVGAVAEMSGDRKAALLAFAHADDAHVPALDDHADAADELERLAAIKTGVELRAVLEPARVVCGDRIALHRLTAGAFGEFLDLEIFQFFLHGCSPRV